MVSAMVTAKATLGTAACFLVAGLALVGCGGANGNNGSGEGRANSPVVGRWRLSTMSEGDEVVACPGTLTVDSDGLAPRFYACASDEIIEFRGDGTVVYDLPATAAHGKIENRGTWNVAADQDEAAAANPVTVRVTFTQSRRDENNNGAFESDEVYPGSTFVGDPFNVSLRGGTLTLTPAGVTYIIEEGKPAPVESTPVVSTFARL